MTELQKEIKELGDSITKLVSEFKERHPDIIVYKVVEGGINVSTGENNIGKYRVECIVK